MQSMGHMKIISAKRVTSIFVNLRYLRLKLLKYKENNKNLHDTFDQGLQCSMTNFESITLYTMSWVPFERHYSVLYDGAQGLLYKCKKWRLTRFAMKLILFHNDLSVV